MKTRILTLVGLFVLGTSMVFGQVKAEKFEVKGSCGMCESRIEKAANSVEGVKGADWNKETKVLKISLDESKTTLAKVQMAIAKVGHDTPTHKAKDEVYNALPKCCKYDRTEKKTEMKSHDGHTH